MITRRKLLAWFGLGGAAAAVASKVEAAVGETNGVTALPAFDMLTERTADGVERVEYAGSILEDMPPITLDDPPPRLVSNSGLGVPYYDSVALFARDEGEHKPASLALSSTKPVGEGWSRYSGPLRDAPSESLRAYLRERDTPEGRRGMGAAFVESVKAELRRRGE